MEKIFLDREVNGVTFDRKLLKYWKEKYGKKAMQTQQGVDVAKHSSIVTYNDGTIREIMKNSNYPPLPTEKADTWDDNDEIGACVYSANPYI